MQCNFYLKIVLVGSLPTDLSTYPYDIDPRILMSTCNELTTIDFIKFMYFFYLVLMSGKDWFVQY